MVEYELNDDLADSHHDREDNDGSENDVEQTGSDDEHSSNGIDRNEEPTDTVVEEVDEDDGENENATPLMNRNYLVPMVPAIRRVTRTMLDIDYILLSGV